MGIDRCEMPECFCDDTSTSFSGGWVPIIPIEPISSLIIRGTIDSPRYIVTLKGKRPTLSKVSRTEWHSDEDVVRDLYFPTIPLPTFDDKVHFERDTVPWRVFTANGIPVFNHLTNYRAHAIASLMIEAIQKLEVGVSKAKTPFSISS